MKILSTFVMVMACVVGLHAATDEPGSSVEPTDGTPSTQEPTSTSSTTAAPASTATVPASSIAPGEHTEGQWYVNKSNITCIRMDMQLDFVIEYTRSNNTKHNITFTLPGTETLTPAKEGHCQASGSKDALPTEDITLDFKGYTNWTVFFNYVKDDKQYYCNEVVFKFTMTEEHFPDIKEEVKSATYSLVNVTLFEVDVGNSWQCKTSQSVHGFLEGNGANEDHRVVSMDTHNLQSQAFATKSEDIHKSFSSAIPCSDDSEVSNIVPIAVGAALAALVVIVLIAYLIGRRRNKRGYESV